MTIYTSYLALLGFEQLFHYYCTITDCTYKEVGGQEGDGMCGGAGWEAGGRLHLPIGLFGASMSPRNASHRPSRLKGLKRCLTNTGVNIRPIPPI